MKENDIVHSDVCSKLAVHNRFFTSSPRGVHPAAVWGGGGGGAAGLQLPKKIKILKTHIL
jgi:hypothetical protein